MSKRLKTDFKLLIGEVAPSVSPAVDVSQDYVTTPDETSPAHLSAPQVGQKLGTLKQRTRQQSLYLEIPVHEALREIAFAERTSLHSLFLEGVDAVLKKRGAPSIKEMVRAKAKPIL